MLKVVNDSNLSSHCGIKHTLKKLYHCMTWPNINRDVSKSLCHKQAKCNGNKTLGRARDPHANGAWLNKRTE